MDELKTYRLRKSYPYSLPSDWKKSSYAATARLYNASTSSKSASNVLGLISYTNKECTEEECNFFEDSNSHDEVCASVSSWIDNEYSLTPDGGSQSERVCFEKPLPQCIQHCLQQKIKIPDVSFYDENGNLLIQIEIMSNRDRKATIWKLAYGLTDQLRYYKSIDSEISFCDGFYWPVGKGFVEHVRCQWDDYKFHYALTCTQLPVNVVRDRFDEAIRYAEENVGKCAGRLCHLFTIPMSKHYIEKNRWRRSSTDTFRTISSNPK